MQVLTTYVSPKTEDQRNFENSGAVKMSDAGPDVQWLMRRPFWIHAVLAPGCGQLLQATADQVARPDRSPTYILFLLPIVKERAAMVSNSNESWVVSLTNKGTWPEAYCELYFSQIIGNSLGCCSPSFSWSGVLWGIHFVRRRKSRSGQYHLHQSLEPFMD